jgi:hypothetical protein
MKIPEFKRSRIGLIAEFRGIPNGFPNQAYDESQELKQQSETKLDGSLKILM